MGNYTVVIEGVGCHDNNRSSDVEHLTKRFVDELRAHYHSVTAAKVVVGYPRDVATRYNEVPLVTDKAEHFEREAHAAYERYIAHSGGLNYEGKPCPKWAELPQAIRDHWVAAVDKFYEQTICSAAEEATNPGR